MPRTIEENNKLKEDRINKVLKSSLKLFVMHGFDSVSMDQICKDVGCSHGLIYHYFTNKLEILEALKKQSQIVFNKEFLKINKENKDLLTNFKKTHSFIIKSLKESEDKRYYLFLFLTIAQSKSLNEELKKYVDKKFKYLVNVFKEIAKNNPELSNINPKEAAFSYYNYLVGTLYITIKNPDYIKFVSEDFILDIIKV